MGDSVAVVAGYLRQRDLSDLVELCLRESYEGIATLVPEPVTFSEVSELDANDTGKRWSHKSTMEGRL